MHPKVLAQSRPDHPAVIDSDTGRSISFAEMDAASNRFAQLLRSHGLQSGDVIALMIENCPEFFNLTWGAQRAGLFYVCISTRLTQAEIDYILADSGAKLFVALQAMPFIDGTEVDYVREGLNQLFKFHNPKAQNECGCGESFGV